MSFANPTPLRVGMTGTLAGTRYRVAGRVVLGMEDAGETYYWNEFNLVDDAGDSVTLVYEESESGGEWKLFTWFEPDNPRSVPEAAAQRVGDEVNFDGTPLRVTLVDESRVYHIEGEAPEGVEMGDVAHYFNAEAGNKMQVASWTGDEVEYYRGVDLPRGTVATAFGLPSERSAASFLSAPDEGGLASSGVVLKVVGALLFLAIIFASYSSCRPTVRRPTLVKTTAPSSPLTVGSSFTLAGKNYIVTSHAVVEIAQVGQVHERHEYKLLDHDGNPALLVYGLKPSAKDGALFTPIQPLDPLTPQQAAALRAGDTVNLDGSVAPVSQLFRSVIRQADSPESPDSRIGTMSFGFSGKSGETLLLARWNDGGIAFYRGRNLDAKEVTAGFRQPPQK